MATKLEIHRIPGNKVRLSWLTKTGHTYQLQRTQNYSAYLDVGPVINGDGSTKTVDEPISFLVFGWFYRIKEELPQGAEPPQWAISSLSAPRVLVQWEPFGPNTNGQYQIFRNNTLLAVTTADSNVYIDAAVSSGGIYQYRVKYFSS